MPDWAGGLASKPVVIVLTCSVVAIAGAASIGYRRYLRSRPGPEEIERLRREWLNANGKILDGEIIEVAGRGIIYSYSARGVGYTASQDVGPLESLLPADRMTMIGPVSLKFDPKNPANSIVLCEQWSGLRKSQPQMRRTTGLLSSRPS